MDDLRHIYSLLLFTGYLKCIQIESPHGYVLQIPNHEIKTIYQQFFIEWFSNQVMTYRPSFQKALLEGDVLEARKILNLLLARSISYFDYNENFLSWLLFRSTTRSTRQIKSRIWHGEIRYRDHPS